MTDVQQRILNIYKSVAAICRRNAIPFYAIGGTAIGAIRHKGFIPWDDDLDIVVPIEHWDLLARSLNEQLPDDLYMLDPSDLRPYHYFWRKVCDRTTTFIETSEFGIEEAYKGVFIDIMPISGLPAKDPEKFVERLKALFILNDHLRFPWLYRTPKARMLDLALSPVRALRSYDWYTRKYFELLRSQPLGQASLTGNVWAADNWRRLNFPIEFFREPVEVEFEDTYMLLPSRPHEYLTLQFGDYMKIPPEGERETHQGIIDLEHPFTHYRGLDIATLKEIAFS